VLSVDVLSVLRLPAASWALPARMRAITVPLPVIPPTATLYVVPLPSPWPWSPRRTAEGHITGGKVVDRLAEDDREVDRRATGWIRLIGGLVDCHRRAAMS